MRPNQWVKNLLIFVAPLTSGKVFHATVVEHTLYAFVAFCLVSSGVYLLNDIRDIEADRSHPTKRFRAIAAGHLLVPNAVVVSVILQLVGFAIAVIAARSIGLVLILAIYEVLTTAYAFGLKNVAIIELVIVANGFFMRAYAGAVASHIPASTWFLVVISFGAFYLVVGKRSSELMHLGVGSTRKVLSDYTPEFLQSVLTMSSTVIVTAYCLWAFDTSTTGLMAVQHSALPIHLSVVPVVMAILFIMKSAESSSGQSPEDLLLKDKVVQSLLVVWMILIVIGIYA